VVRPLRDSLCAQRNAVGGGQRIGLGELLKILLQRGIRLLRGGAAARLQRLSPTGEKLADLAASVRAAALMIMMMMVVVVVLRPLLLEVLLDLGLILLCGRRVSGLQVGGELVEILGESAGALG